MAAVAMWHEVPKLKKGRASTVGVGDGRMMTGYWLLTGGDFFKEGSIWRITRGTDFSQLGKEITNMERKKQKN